MSMAGFILFSGMFSSDIFNFGNCSWGYPFPGKIALSVLKKKARNQKMNNLAKKGYFPCQSSGWTGFLRYLRYYNSN